ncbi:MAG: C40 family peptidase [Casimicrobiaceae bacterium]
MRVKSPHLQHVATACCLLSLVTIAPPVAAQARDDTTFAVAATATVKAAAVNAMATAEHLSRFAMRLLGVNYRWGGTSPETGLDCSGLVRYVFQQVTGVNLPHSSKEMSRVGKRITVDELAPGDLVFFNTRRYAFSHVGIYLGNNRFLHAPAAGRDVEIATLDGSYWQKRFNGARRLIGVLPTIMPALVAEAMAAPLDASTASPPPVDSAPSGAEP